jgi:hypothetical protein
MFPRDLESLVMPIEEDFTNTLRAELSSRDPDTRILLAGAMHRGRRRRRRRVSLLSVAAVVLLAGTTGVIVRSLPQAAGPARPSVVTVVPATPPSSSSPSAAATTSPSPASTPQGQLQGDQIEARLKALLPAGITVSIPTNLAGDTEQSNFELDDGNGKSFLAVQAQWLADPTSARDYLRTVTTPRPDGILVQIEQIPYQRGIVRNQVVNLLSPGGFSLGMNLSQAAVPDQVATARARPILTAAQLMALATSPEWEQSW